MDRFVPTSTNVKLSQAIKRPAGRPIIDDGKISGKAETMATMSKPKPKNGYRSLLGLLRADNIAIACLILIACIQVARMAMGPDAKTEALRKRIQDKNHATLKRQTLILKDLRLKASRVTTIMKEDGTSEEYKCLGWKYDPKSPYQCSWGPSRILPAWMLSHSCDEYVGDSAGYCEWSSSTTGKIKRLLHKPCQRALIPGELHQPPYLTCQMAVAFANYKHRARHFQPKIPIPIAGDASRGIVMQAYLEVLPSVFTILSLLRNEYRCQLPVELWFGKDELVSNHSILLQILTTWPGVTTRVISDPTVESYMSKPYSVAYSHFDEILFLDSDNFPLNDPIYLFDGVEYKSKGAIFWKDFWSVHRSEFYLRRDSLLWELLDIPPDSPLGNDMEMESGQLVINRRQTKEALETLVFFAQTFKEWFEPLGLLLGDKDLFRFAWHLHEIPFHYMEKPPGMVGPKETRSWQMYRYQNTFCGLTMVQYDPLGQPIFLHRNAVKLTEENGEGLTPIWERGAKFVGTDDSKQYKVGFNFVSHHLLGRMCYYPHKAFQKYFMEEDYDMGGINSHEFHPIRVLEERIIFYAKQANALLPRFAFPRKPL